jgi:hypothetical protein
MDEIFSEEFVREATRVTREEQEAVRQESRRRRFVRQSLLKNTIQQAQRCHAQARENSMADAVILILDRNDAWGSVLDDALLAEDLPNSLSMIALERGAAADLVAPLPETEQTARLIEREPSAGRFTVVVVAEEGSFVAHVPCRSS